MQIFIDADACPVVDIAIKQAEKFNVPCTLICDTAHVFNKAYAKTIIVEKGADSADFKLVNLIEKNDIAITQDYGLAAMCLARKAVVINQNGMIYNDKNIDELLFSRYVSKKIRNSGGHLKGPSKRTTQQDAKFLFELDKLLKMNGEEKV